MLLEDGYLQIARSRAMLEADKGRGYKVRKCNNGLYTADNLDELLSLLSWNLRSWDENYILQVAASISRGIWANSGGPCHATISIVPDLAKMFSDEKKPHNFKMLQTKVFVPTPNSYLENADRIFADIEEDSQLYYYNYLRDTKTPIIENYDFTLLETVDAVFTNIGDIEKAILPCRIHDAEFFILRRGFIRFGFHGSLHDKKTHLQWLAVMPRGIIVKHRNEDKLLHLSVGFKYPNDECVL